MRPQPLGREAGRQPDQGEKVREVDVRVRKVQAAQEEHELLGVQVGQAVQRPQLESADAAQRLEKRGLSRHCGLGQEGSGNGNHACHRIRTSEAKERPTQQNLKARLESQACRASMHCLDKRGISFVDSLS